MAKRKAEVEVKPVKKPSKTQNEVQYTLCVPSSVISAVNAKNLQQITQIAHQIARAATIYNVGEIVVLDIPTAQKKEEEAEKSVKVVLGSTDKGGKKIKFNFDDEDIVQKKAPETVVEEESKDDNEEEINGSKSTSTTNENNTMLLATLLQYFITPPYLVKSVFANNEYNTKFKYAQHMPKLSTLPFMSNNEVWRDFREGLTIPKHTPKITSKKNKKISPKNKLSTTKYVNIGEAEPMVLEKDVPVNVRVTVDLKNKVIVSPLQAYGTIGNKSSFGYFVRVAKTFSTLFTESSVPEGYSSSIYVKSDDYFQKSDSNLVDYDKEKIHVKGGNVLLVLGNWFDIEYSFSREGLEGVDSVSQMFDGELKIPSGVKIEDAALISLAKVYS
ncbi:hypothetical protein CAAN1_02S01552 [[Candida] anglica]|uniref:Methyltransferase n=1 Tax=[Candida] anglica TaxID=148631 RepID=A0ABP0EAW7_9ASCO